ncbi:MAG: Stp1/IreP family PP2C-type Ser/Thr phosphatase [Acidobacteria bacterium]|nr:Stp1/IreP family PP2C-type Ser/Thr phosphatase [Acidobacteriota bacterium]
MTSVSAAGLTHPGKRRQKNEDSYCARPDLGLFVVADGMGGHAAGEVASRVAVETIEQFISETRAADENFTWPFGLEPNLDIDGNRLKTAVKIANRRIATRVAGERDLQGMATTVVAVLIGRRSVIVAHVGDSRVYHWRDDRMTRLTRDHSWVEEQVEAGALTPIEARDHPWRNLVTRALSGGGEVEIDLTALEVKPGDRLLLCSDGLFSVVPDEAIGETLGRHADDLQSICSDLVDAANRAGGPDNVTVLVLRFDVA